MRQGYYDCGNNWRVQKGHPILDHNINQLIWCTVGFTNKYWHNTGRGIDTQLVFISNSQEIHGLYFWNVDRIHHDISVAKCNTAQVGLLYVYAYCQIPIRFHDIDNTNPKLTYSNFLQDVFVKREYKKSYVEYMQGLIDNLIKQQDMNDMNYQNNDTTVMISVSFDVLPSSSVIQPPLASHLNELSAVGKQDINDKIRNMFFYHMITLTLTS